MSAFIDRWFEPGLWLLGDWSLRWGVLIVLLGLWFAVRPPRQAGLRLAACQLVLLAGLALPLVPRWWGQGLLPSPAERMVDDAGSARDKTLARNGALHSTLPEPTLPPLAALAEPNGAAEPVDAEIAVVRDSAPAAEPLGAFRIMLLISAVLWLVGTCVQLAQLIAGAIGLSRLSGEVGGPGPQAQDLFERCCADMNLRRRVRLGIHPTLAGPVFVGGRRALVLVPLDWEQLAPESQRAVLWHELAHAARRDDLAKLVEETVRAVSFFHPLVHWLLNRLDAYREQVCDAAAVRHGVAGRTLAQILVDFSRRKAEPGDRVIALRPALPFFRRRTVKNRIAELLSEQTVSGWSVPLGGRQLLGLAAFALLTGIALGGFGARVAGSPADLPQFNDTGSNSGGPPTATANQKVGSKTLERILANWKAREERTRSLHFEWENHLFLGEAARREGKAVPLDPRSCRVSEWIEGFDRRRTDTAPLGASAPNASVVGLKTHAVDNGSTALSVDDSDKKAGWPVATISPRQTPNLLFRPNGVALTFHTLHAFEVNPHSPQFRVVSEDAVINGLHCVELQNSNDKPALVEKCWVDPARDDVVVTYEFWVRAWPPAQKRRELYRAIAIEYQRDPVHGWVPARFTVRQPGSLLSENTVTKYTINERFPDDTFSLKVSTGTIVFDERSSERYRAVADRGKMDLVKFDSRASMRIAETLESRSDFRIEPQSLKDALDFISARYQIPIILQKADFEAAGVNPAAEVVERRTGIKLVDLLSTLFAQCGKRVGFRIEDEVLKVSPKFPEQGELRVRPAPEPQKPETPRARKVRESLEQPVDFNVEPQSLKDALDFIAARYQIKIEIDPVVDELVKVRGNYPGIKLRSLLSILLEQCPGELAFKIDHDALKIYSKTATR
jgi:hypothetical protein